jgi:hypothetical protein
MDALMLFLTKTNYLCSNKSLGCQGFCLQKNVGYGIFLLEILMITLKKEWGAPTLSLLIRDFLLDWILFVHPMTETNLALPFIPQAESHLVAGMIKYLSKRISVSCQKSSWF